jgi:hypothetical protein
MEMKPVWSQLDKALPVRSEAAASGNYTDSVTVTVTY